MPTLKQTAPTISVTTRRGLTHLRRPCVQKSHQPPESIEDRRCTSAWWPWLLKTVIQSSSGKYQPTQTLTDQSVLSFWMHKSWKSRVWNTNLCVVFSHSLDITVPASDINKMCNGAFRLFRSFMLLLGELEGKVTLHHGHVPIWETMRT